MQAFSVLVLVLLCGGAFAQPQKPRVVKLDPAIEGPCQRLTHLTDAEVQVMKELKFDELSANQKEFMHCYMKKGKMVNDASEILVENVPFGTPEKAKACKAKLGKVLSYNHVLAFVVCLQGKKLQLCEVAKLVD